MKLRLLSVIAVAIITVSSAAFALDLQTARKSGAVGEKLDGYIAVVKPSADAEALVADVNKKRKQEYEKISKQNGQPVDVVAKLAAEQIINKLATGSLYQNASGSWQSK